jgi:hypothetical protein
MPANVFSGQRHLSNLLFSVVTALNKVKHSRYTQLEGREELFERG